MEPFVRLSESLCGAYRFCLQAAGPRRAGSGISESKMHQKYPKFALEVDAPAEHIDRVEKCSAGHLLHTQSQSASV